MNPPEQNGTIDGRWRGAMRKSVFEDDRVFTTRALAHVDPA
jgi:hypothetical protein